MRFATKHFHSVGEMTSAGSYACMDCRRVIHVDRVIRLPPCPHSRREKHRLNAWRALDHREAEASRREAAAHT